MFKYLLLLVPLLSFGSISVSPVDWHYKDDYVDGYVYDLDIQFEYNQSINVEDFFIMGDEGSVIYYEHILFKPFNSGWYTFDNYNSDLTVGTTVVNETQLLIYDSTPNSIIIDEPTGFRAENNNGWGLGLSQAGFEHSDPPQEFYGAVQLTGNEEYHIVFSSFKPDAYGTLDVEIFYEPDNNMTTLEDFGDFTSIPEPSTYALLAGFITFLIVAIRRR